MVKEERRSVVLGVDFGATNLKALIIDKNGKKLEAVRFALKGV